MPLRLPVLAEPIYKPDLVRRILVAIFGGRWKEGERLREVELADQFGVSRTPVREALQEIASIGLIELKPNCGAVVAPFGPREIEEIYEVRALLESEATRLACPRLRADEVKSLLEDTQALLTVSRRNKEWMHRAWAADHRLHEMLTCSCGNRRLAREVGDYATFVQIIRETLGNRDRVQDHAIAEHIAILEALRAGKSDEAGNVMKRHVLSAGRTAVEALRPNFALPVRAGARAAL